MNVGLLFWKHPPRPQPKTVWTEPLVTAEVKTGLSYSEFVYHTCSRIKLDMQEHQQEYCLAVTDSTWREIVSDPQLRSTLRYSSPIGYRPTWPGEVAMLYGVRIVVLRPWERYLPDGAVPTDIENWPPISEFTGPEWGYKHG